MKEKIENPKVFISYAWATKEYEAKVLAFASKLVSDGIDVVIDKWDMSEGNDTYSFMERCVTDPTITNVLMLIDPVYAKKADSHTGGVGTETQIISAKVYQEVSQDKFIPIVFERDEFGGVCKPTYLQGRLHFDLSMTEEYDETYQRLVKKLFGEEVYSKPKLGKKPTWVEKPTDFSPKSILQYEELKKNTNSKSQRAQFISFLKTISEHIIAFSNRPDQLEEETDCIQEYDTTLEIRTEYLLLLKYANYIENYQEDIAAFFEDTCNALYDRRNWRGTLAKTFLHELFLYTIACLWNNKDYMALGNMLSRTYFTKSYSRGDTGATSYALFYSGGEHEILDRAVRKANNRNYYSGTAAHWMSNIAIDFCSKEQFIFADLLCFNYSIYGKNYIYDWRWFPITYGYENEYDSMLRQFAKKLISSRYLKSILPIFDFESSEDFIKHFKDVHSEKNDLREYRYSGAYEPANVLGYFIQPDKIGTLP